MADETTNPEQQNRGTQVIIDERDLQMVYTNAYRIHAADDVVVDFGYNMPNPNPTQQGTPQVLYKGTHRVIMSYANAKRLAGSLAQLIKRFEQQFVPGDEIQRTMLPVRLGGRGQEPGQRVESSPEPLQHVVPGYPGHGLVKLGVERGGRGPVVGVSGGRGHRRNQGAKFGGVVTGDPEAGPARGVTLKQQPGLTNILKV